MHAGHQCIGLQPREHVSILVNLRVAYPLRDSDNMPNDASSSHTGAHADVVFNIITDITLLQNNGEEIHKSTITVPET